MMTAENLLLKPNKEQNKEVQRNGTLCQFSGFTYQEIMEYTACDSNRANYLRKKARKEPLFLNPFNPPLIRYNNLN